MNVVPLHLRTFEVLSHPLPASTDMREGIHAVVLYKHQLFEMNKFSLRFSKFGCEMCFKSIGIRRI